MPFQWRIYFISLRQALKIQAPWSGPRIAIFLFVLSLPFLQILNWLTLMLDNILFPGYRKIEVKDPVFIVGNARSGTTYIHRLMSLDKENLNSFKTWEIILVSVCMKKLVYFLAGVDKSLGGYVARAIENIQNHLFKEADRIHKVRLNHPEEDELVMSHIYATGFLQLIFPIRVTDELAWFDRLPLDQRRQIMGFYKEMVKRQLYVHGGGNLRLLSKNPLFSTKIESIYDTFPDARIVYMARTPYETVASLLNMVDRIWKAQLHVRNATELQDAIVGFLIYSYHYALERLDAHDQNSNIMVKYEDLVNRPRETVEQIYAKFGFPMDPGFVAALQKVTEKSKGYKSEHQYSLEQFGVSKTRVYQETRDVFERFGFDPEGEFADNPELMKSEARI